MIHAIQHSEYGNAMTPTVRNYEFEAKVFKDLACVFDKGFCTNYGSWGQSDKFISNYKNWTDDFYFDNKNQFTQTDVNLFKSFCSEWTGDLDQNGNVRPNDSSFIPKVLQKYFKK